VSPWARVAIAVGVMFAVSFVFAVTVGKTIRRMGTDIDEEEYQRRLAADAGSVPEWCTGCGHTFETRELIDTRCAECTLGPMLCPDEMEGL